VEPPALTVLLEVEGEEVDVGSKGWRLSMRWMAKEVDVGGRGWRLLMMVDVVVVFCFSGEG
jgi:hypothetical protein